MHVKPFGQTALMYSIVIVIVISIVMDIFVLLKSQMTILHTLQSVHLMMLS